MGFFEDAQVAFVQTPHHFYNPDIFQKNLRLERSLANEQSLFYRVLQAGRDRHNSAFFAGSCGLFRRGPLQEIGGFRTETVTEDIHTSMTLHAKGYRSCYLNKILAVGLSPESFDSFIKQRIRWAMGHVQMLFRSNPLLVPGLTIHQRLGYFASIWYFLHGLPRLISLIAPLFALLLGIIPITADVWSLAHFFGAYYVATVLMLKVVDRGTRNAFWSDVYETAGSVALCWALVKTMLRPWKPRPFVITPKGRQQANRGIAEFKYVIPHLLLFGLLIAGVTTGIRAWMTGTVIPGLGISLFWGITNLILIGVALLSAVEWPEWRKTHRVPCQLPCRVITSGEHIEGLMVDLSEEGAKIQISRPNTDLPARVLIQLTDPQGNCVRISGKVRRQDRIGESDIAVGLAFSELDEKSVHVILRTLSADASIWNRPQSDPGIWGSFWALLSVFGRVWTRARRSRRGDERLKSTRPCDLIFEGQRIQCVLHDVSSGGFLIKTTAPAGQLRERGLVEMEGFTAHVRRMWAMDCHGSTMAGFRIEAPVRAQTPRPVHLEDLPSVSLAPLIPSSTS